MISTNDPKALREVLRYYRRVQAVNRRLQVPQRDWKSKDELLAMTRLEAEIIEKLRTLDETAPEVLAHEDAATPECWR